MKKGLFWCKGYDGDSSELVFVDTECDAYGNCLEENICFSSKSGDNFNHRIEWEKLDKSVTEGKPFNYYPRGRVEIRKGKATVFMNPDINREDILKRIDEEFDIFHNDALKSVTIKNDGSSHYKHADTTPI